MSDYDRIRRVYGVRRRFIPSIPPGAATSGVFSWDNQAAQYDEDGPPGVGYFRGEVEEMEAKGHPDFYVDCLLYRGADGTLLGILNHYPMTDPVNRPPLEVAGNVNIWVHPDHYGQGIGTALFIEAQERWGPINLDQQRYTTPGANFAEALVRKGLAT